MDETTVGMSDRHRQCIVCGANLAARRSDCATCSPECEERASVIWSLLRGEPAGGAGCLEDYYDILNGSAGRLTPSHRGEKSDRRPLSVSPRRRSSRTSRAEAWLAERVRERPGHVTLAMRLYTSYRAWARQHDPEGPLGYTAFLNVVDRGAPIEGRVRLMTERGRPQLAFEGIVLGAGRRATVVQTTATGLDTAPRSR